MFLVSLVSALLATLLRENAPIADLVAEPAQIDLGPVEQGKTYQAKFVLQNRCRGELRISGSPPSVLMGS